MYIVGGSGRVINPNTVSVLQAFTKSAPAQWKVVHDTSDNVESSLNLLQSADIGIICGSTWSTEGTLNFYYWLRSFEGVDRKDLYIDQEKFVSGVLSGNGQKIPTVVALNTPGPVWD